jgi:glycosyltransferase involved in cell wall biosynthesis
MKLLHVIRSTDPTGGGPIEVVRQFSRVHLQQGHQVEVASLDLPAQIFAGDDELPTHKLGATTSSYGHSPQLIPWLREHAARFDAAIIHGLWQFHGRATRLALQGTATPYFVYPHGMLDPWFRRAYPLKHLKKIIYWRLVEHKVLRDAAAVLYTCEEERRLAQKTFSPYRCVEKIAPLGISEPTGDPAQQRELFLTRFPHLRGKRLLLFLGRLHDKKGCDILLRAFARVLKAHRAPEHEAPLHLVMAGPPASETYLHQLQTLADAELRQAGLSNRQQHISFPGMLFGDLKWGAYHAAEAFVLPSHQENFGIAVVEALACGTPVLISDKVNIWREIQQDGAGLIAEDTGEGTFSLLERWATLLPEQKQVMPKQARLCFEKHFHIEAASIGLHQLLESMIKPRPAQRELHAHAVY